MAMNPRLLRPKASGFKYQLLRQGLVAYWPLNETATSGDVTAKDESGRGNDLASNNSVLSAAGKIGNARDFVSANTEWLSRASNADLTFGNGDWTVSAWIWQATRSTSAGMIIGKDESGQREFNVFVAPANNAANVRIEYPGVSGSQQCDVTGVMVDSTWHFVAVRKLGTTVTLRVDTTTNSFTNANTFNTGTSPFNVGRRSFTGFLNYFNGRIDEVAKWSRGLSNAELDELYNSGNGINLGQRA
jgi:hypothetical protein